MSDYVIDCTINGTTTRVRTQPQTPLIQVVLDPTQVVIPSAPVITTGIPEITTASLPDATQNATYAATLNVTGGVAPYTWALVSGTLPTGLSLSSAGVISGTPTGIGTSSFTISVRDQALSLTSKLFTLTVVASATPTFGSHLGDWLVQGGDQALTMPDGTYDAAHINLAGMVHAATGGAYNGWLVIKATTRLGVTIDLSSLALHLESTSLGGATPRRTPRILFVGISFVNGQIPIEWLQYMRFYWCTFTDPPSAWNGQYTTAYQALHGGASPTNLSTIDDTAVGNMANPYGTTVSGKFADLFEFYFCDWYQVYDDANYLTGCDSWYYQGCRWWDVYNHNIQYRNADGSTRAHSDNIQANGGVTSLVAKNCSFTHLELDATNGAGSCTIFIYNFWLMAGDNVGIAGGNDYQNDGVTVRHSLTGVIQAGQWCGMAQYQPSDKTNPTYSVTQYGTYTNGSTTLAYNDRIGYGEDSTKIGNLTWKRSNGTTINLSTANTEWFSYPSGVSQPGAATASPGIIAPDLTDSPIRPIATAIIPNHASNPAVVDRAVSGHAWTDWATFFAQSRTDASCGTTSGSATVTDASIALADIGKMVSGTGIAADSRITSVVASTSFTMSKNATATGTVSLAVGIGWP